MAVRHLDASVRLYPKTAKAVGLYWNEGVLCSRTLTAERWARLEVKSQDNPAIRLPVAFDETRQAPYTEEHWVALCSLDAMRDTRRQTVGYHAMMAQVKTVDPLMRYPNQHGPLEGLPFALGLVRYGVFPLPQMVKFLTALSRRTELDVLEFEGQTLLDAALNRAFPDAPFLADWLAERGVRMAERPAEDRAITAMSLLINRIMGTDPGGPEAAMKLTPAAAGVVASRETASSEHDRILQQRFLAASERWAVNLGTDRLLAQKVCLVSPNGASDYTGPLQGWLLREIVARTPSLLKDAFLCELAHGAAAAAPETVVKSAGKDVTLDALLTPPAFYGDDAQQRASAVRARWLATHLEHSLHPAERARQAGPRL